MKSLLALTTIIIIFFVVIIIKLIIHIRILNRKIKYVDEADMWHKLAVTDDLTGVYNRNAYNSHISRRGKYSGIILFDVNDFKQINDTLGHLAGDAVLKEIAQTLLQVFPEPQYKVFRIGGDEFSVLSKDISEKDIINNLINLEKCLNINRNISLSKGYSIIKDNPEEAFKYADEMLYADKMAKRMRNYNY